jgi:hypothetical protein
MPILNMSRELSEHVFDCNKQNASSMLTTWQHRYLTVALWLHVSDPSINFSLSLITIKNYNPLHRTTVNKVNFIKLHMPYNFFAPRLYFSKKTFLSVTVHSFRHHGPGRTQAAQRNVKGNLVNNLSNDGHVSADMMPTGSVISKIIIFTIALSQVIQKYACQSQHIVAIVYMSGQYFRAKSHMESLFL